MSINQGHPCVVRAIAKALDDGRNSDAAAIAKNAKCQGAAMSQVKAPVVPATAGSWKVYEHDPLIIVNINGSSLGEMTPGDPYISYPEALANARLAAAAPDLLKALQDAHVAMDCAWAGLGDRLLAEGPLDQSYAHSVTRQLNAARETSRILIAKLSG